MDCKECGFHKERGDGFCTDVCQQFWKRRTLDPLFWTNLPREAKVTGMSPEVKEKLRQHKQTTKEEQEAANKALEADEALALQEREF